MNNDSVVTLAVALVCLFAIGSAAGSLESAVDSSPSEAIDLDYASLPLDEGDASDIKREYQSMTKDPNGQSEESESASETGPPTKQNQAGESGDQKASSAASDRQQTGTGPGGPQDWLDKLLDALMALLGLLVKLLVAAIVLVGAALAVRYREQLASRLSPVLDRFGNADTEEFDPAEFTPPATPENEVTAAWYEMVRQMELDDDGPLTPRERAALARRKGADANTIWSLTELFEEVQYGGAPVTDDRRRRAREYVDRLRRTTGGNES